MYALCCGLPCWMRLIAMPCCSAKFRTTPLMFSGWLSQWMDCGLPRHSMIRVQRADDACRRQREVHLDAEALGVPVQTILSDNGREFSGRPEQHAYQLLLALHDIEHRTTKVRSPRTNGFVERMNRTLLDEHFRIKGQEKWYESIDEIQDDLDVLIEFYNLKRSHQGYRLKCRTPAQALREALGRKKLPQIIPKEDETAVLKAA